MRHCLTKIKIKKTDLKERDCKVRTYQYIAEPRVRAI